MFQGLQFKLFQVFIFTQFGLKAQKPTKSGIQKMNLIRGDTRERSIGTSGAICSLNSEIKEVNRWVTEKIRRRRGWEGAQELQRHCDG